MSEENINKSKHGEDAKDSIKHLLDWCSEQKLIKSYKKNYRDGRTGYSKNQFHAPFIITFYDEEKWIIYSTTSFRKDRFKGLEWDTYNLKEVNSEILKSYLVYPDGTDIDEIRKFVSHNKRIITSSEYSSIDSIVNQTTLLRMIEGKAVSGMSKGQKTDAKGKKFENNIVSILNSSKNLDKLQNNSRTKTGVQFKTYKKILTALNVNISNIKNVQATDDSKVLGVLPSGGPPKTDVLVKVLFNDGSQESYTISCKRTSAKSVSVHQYSYETFSNVLDAENEVLRNLLKEFQYTGSLRDFGADNIDELTKEIEPYLRKLSMWVFGGINGAGDPNTQWARYLITYKNENGECDIHTVEEYYQMLLDKEINGHFGTVFSWTYASKSKGKNIQLKTKIL